ncbi:MAG: hypothetical protein IBX44_02580 [Sulfurospirillum sp.]|nr:hypothetical protein [Sulfurospirillum sp.]
MSSNFIKAFDKVIELEGGYTLHKNQTESAVTYAGIYRKAHPKWSGWEYVDKEETPPTQLVREFYYERYYKAYENLDHNIAYVMFESSVNMGATAVKLAQRVLNIADDGVAGAKTLTALKGATPREFLYSFTIAKIAYYNHLASKEQYKPYLRGWINRSLKSLEGIV